MQPKACVTITFGDVAENHTGNQMIGEKCDSGFTQEDIITIYHHLIANGFQAEYHQVPKPPHAPPEVEEVLVIVIRQGVHKIFSSDHIHPGTTDGIKNEMMSLEWDKKFYNARVKKVQNKKARHVLCFDDVSQAANYEAGMGTVYAWEQLPHLKYVKEYLHCMFGEKSRNLKAEGNYYYNIEDCGIGYHGDSERRKVIALRLGASMPIYYQWYQPVTHGNSWKAEPYGEKYAIELHDGDMYIMGQKAAGTDWKKRSAFTVRHATGCLKYTHP